MNDWQIMYIDYSNKTKNPVSYFEFLRCLMSEEGINKLKQQFK